MQKTPLVLTVRHYAAQTLLQRTVCFELADNCIRNIAAGLRVPTVDVNLAYLYCNGHLARRSRRTSAVFFRRNNSLATVQYRRTRLVNKRRTTLECADKLVVQTECRVIHERVQLRKRSADSLLLTKHIFEYDAFDGFRQHVSERCFRKLEQRIRNIPVVIQS